MKSSRQPSRNAHDLSKVTAATAPSPHVQAPDELQRMAAASGATGRLIPVTDWSAYHPWPPVGGLRHLIFHADNNGFDQVLRRVGRRVLIDEAAFFNWVNQRGGAE